MTRVILLKGYVLTFIGSDVRVLEAVECPDLNHLENVIVFPVTGKRPIADTVRVNHFHLWKLTCN